MELYCTIENVHEILRAACSQDILILNQAEEALTSLHLNSNFYLLLVQIIMDYNVELTIRWMAVLYFKNGIDKYWRKNAPGSLEENVKSEIRLLLENSFLEPAPQIAKQLFLVVSKIARIDVPNDWSSLVFTLKEHQSNDYATKLKYYLFLNQIFKSLASRRLPKDKIFFQQFSEDFLKRIINDFIESVTLFSQSNESFNSHYLEIAILSIKIFKRMIAFGYSNISNQDQILEFISFLFNLVENMSLNNNLGFDEVKFKKDKLLKNISKMFLLTLENHSKSFVRFITKSFEIFLKICIKNSLNNEAGSLLKINLFNLITHILKCDNYIISSKNDCDNPSKETTLNVFTLFNYEVIFEILSNLFENYFKYNFEELTLWETDQESFVIKNEQEAGYNIYTACTEELFVLLTKIYKEDISKILIIYMTQSESQLDMNKLESVLLLDSVYKAIGLASYHICDNFDFTSWFQTSLVPVLQNSQSNSSILHYRILWLFDKWVRSRLPTSLNEILYQIVSSFLNDQRIVALRIAAMRALKSIFSDINFDVQNYLCYLEEHLLQLINLMSVVNECEIKLEILAMFTILIEKINKHIGLYVEPICSMLFSFWNLNVQFDLLKASSLQTFAKIVEAIGVNSFELHNSIIPLLCHSMETLNGNYMVMSTNSLLLWLTLVHNCPSLDQNIANDQQYHQFLILFNKLPPLLEIGDEDLKVKLRILEAYIVLFTKTFFQSYGELAGACTNSLYHSLNSIGLLQLFKVLETSLKIDSQSSINSFQKLFSNIIISLIKNETVDPPLNTLKLVLLSRLVLHDPSFIYNILTHIYISLQTLLKIWLELIEDINNPEHKKITIIALMFLCKQNIHEISTELWNMLVNACIEAVHDKFERNEPHEVLLENGNICLEELQSAHYHRLQLMQNTDIVYSLNFNDYLKKYLSEFDENFLQQLDQQFISQLKLIII